MPLPFRQRWRSPMQLLINLILAAGLVLQTCTMPALAQDGASPAASDGRPAAGGPPLRYTLSGRVVDQRGSPVPGVEVTAVRQTPPVIFIPGIGGSILKDPGKPWPLWPNVLEPDSELQTMVRVLNGSLPLNAAKTIMRRMAGSADQLMLDPGNGYATSLVAPDVIRWIVNTDAVKLNDVYGSFLSTKLQAELGYRPYQLTQLPGYGCDTTQQAAQPTLFVFPYDWRLPVEESAARLANYVACVQRYHPNEMIDIVAHSMGGLVARRYILAQTEAGQPTHIRRLITLGTPWLGAPKALYALLTGNFDTAVNLALLDTDVFKRLVATFPGAHALLASERYYALAASRYSYPAPLRESGWDMDGKNGAQDVYTYPTYKSLLNTWFSAVEPLTINEQLHSRAGQDDWTGDASSIEYYHILGDAEKTIHQVIGRSMCLSTLVGLGLQCIERRLILYATSMGGARGDGTVPELSGGGNDLDSASVLPVQRRYPLQSPAGNPDKYAHGKLLSDPDVQDCVGQILKTGDCRIADVSASSASAASSNPEEQYQVLVVGVGSALVTDRGGRQTGSLEGAVPLHNIPGVEYYEGGEQALQISAPTAMPLTITFQSTDTPLYVEVLKADASGPINALRYVDLTVPQSTTLALALPLPETSPLSFDGSGDGIPDTPVEQMPISLSGPLAADVEPPSVWLAPHDRLVVVNASDPSGVKATYYSFDGLNYQPTTSAYVTIPSEATRVYAFADDMAGNRAPVQSAPLSAIDRTPPATAIAVAGTKDSAGNYTGSVVVTLTASDNESGIQSTFYSLSGGSYWFLYTAPLTVHPGEAASILAYSIDAAGNIEQPAKVQELPFPPPDTSPPTTLLHVAGNQDEHGRYTTAVTVTLTAEDSGSGVAATYYREEGGDTWVYTEPVRFVPDKTVRLWVYSVDKAGNQEQPQEYVLEFVKDVTMPATTINIVGPRNAMGQYTDDVILLLAAQDDLTGVQASYYSLDGGANWLLFRGFVGIGYGQASSVMAYSVDKAGNRETPPKALALAFDGMAATRSLFLPMVTKSGGASSPGNWSGEAFTAAEAPALLATAASADPFYTGLTRADGSFAFSGLPAGDYVVTAKRLNWPVAEGSQKVRLLAQDANVQFTMTVPTVDADAEVYIPAGSFLMGCDVGSGEVCSYANELPLHKVTLSAYYIDKYEVTNARYQACVAAGACTAPERGTQSYTRGEYYGSPAYADYPVINVGYGQALTFCYWDGKRLPTEAEWERAARGGVSTYKYPWGNLEPDCMRANYNGCINDTTPVGFYPDGGSPEGVMDMAGNVYEWVRDWYGADYYSVSPPKNPTGPDDYSGAYMKVVRGGMWFNQAMSLRAAYRYATILRQWEPYLYGDAIGFRCVRSQ